MRNPANDPPIIFETAKCSAGCGKVYAGWCRGCNLVYCGEHVERTKHKCKPDEVRPQSSKRNPPEKKTEKSKGPESAPKDQLSLFPKPTNGMVQPPPDRGVPENPGPSDDIPI